MAVTQLSQKEYLKKYLSSSNDDKKKKKKKKTSKSALERFRVVDDDIDLKNMRPLEEGELDLYNLAEDAPQIAGIIDERPDDLRALEEFRGSKRWKVMTDESGIEDIKITAIRNGDRQSVSGNKDINDAVDSSMQKREVSAKEKHKISKRPDSDSSPKRKYEDDSDASPPRKSKVYNDSDASPPRKKRTGDVDESPPRKRRKSSDSDPSPPRKYKRDSELSSKKSNSDMSPRRKQKTNGTVSPLRKNRYDVNASPVRKSRHDTELSPIRKSKHNTDLSPVRKSKYETENTTLPQRKSRNDPSPLKRSKHYTDLSPPRKSKIQSDSDTSPPRRQRRSEDSDNKISRNNSKYNTTKTHKNHSDSDYSPPRKNSSKHYRSPVDGTRASFSKTSRNNDSDHSGKSHKYAQHDIPSTSKQRESRELVSQNRNQRGREQSSSLSPYRKTSSQKRTGNRSLENSPNRSLKKYGHSSPVSSTSRRSGSGGRERFDVDSGREKVKGKMDKTLDGKRAGLQDAKELREELTNFRRREDEIFAQMGDEVSGKGAAAVMRDRKTGKRRNLEEEAKQKKAEEEKLAEHREKYSRWGKGLKQVEDQKENLQQALHEMSKPLARYANDEDLETHLRNQDREGDPMLDYIRSKRKEDTTKSKPKYQGSFLPNRFGIPPGHRWDGVDRSNGYEKQWFEHQNARRAVEEEAYKWSTSDM